MTRPHGSWRPYGRPPAVLRDGHERKAGANGNQYCGDFGGRLHLTTLCEWIEFKVPRPARGVRAQVAAPVHRVVAQGASDRFPKHIDDPPPTVDFARCM